MSSTLAHPAHPSPPLLPPPCRSADVNCTTCGNGGQCTACADTYGLQGNRCVLCTGANMALTVATKTKGARCECAAGFEWNKAKTECVAVPAPPTPTEPVV